MVEALKEPEARLVSDKENLFCGPSEVALLSKLLDTHSHAHVKRVMLDVRDGPEVLEKLFSKNTTVTSWALRMVASLTPHVVAGIMANKDCAIVSLELQFQWARQPTYVALVDMVRRKTCLKEVSVHCVEGFRPGEAEKFVEAAVEGGHVEKLALGASNLSSPNVQRVCKMLTYNKTLRKLHVDGNNLGLEGCRWLGNALKEDVVLEELSLNESGVETEGADAIAQGLMHNKTLKMLGLRENKILSARGLAKMLAVNAALTKLDLGGGNRIGDEDVIDLAEALHVNTTLRDLRLLAQGFGDEGVLGLARMLRNNSTLHVLHLEGCGYQCSARGMCELAEALVGHQRLADLFLGAFPPAVSELFEPILKQGNGSLVVFNNACPPFCMRNRAMHQRAREAVQALRVLRWRAGEHSYLHAMVKEVVRMIALALWDTRTEVAAWSGQHQ